MMQKPKSASNETEPVEPLQPDAELLAAELAALKAKLERGAAQAMRGEVVDGPAFMAERRAKIVKRIEEKNKRA